MTEINDRVKVSVNVGDTILARPSFSTVAVLAKHGVAGLSRIEIYTSIDAVLAVFPFYTPVGIAAGLFFGQARTPDKFAVIERGSVETVAAALADAVVVNPDFYFVCSLERDNASITATQDWCQSNSRNCFFSSADSTAVTVTETDPFFYGNDLSYNRSSGWYLSRAGSDILAASITVVSTTATFASVAHGVVVGDAIYPWGSSQASLLGKFTVSVVTGVDAFECVVPLGTVTDAGLDIKVLVNGQFLEVGLLGLMSSTEPGRRTFDLQTVAGISPDTLIDTEKGFLGGKDANYYTTLGGVAITSGLKSNGFGGKTLSGRNIDLQWFLDWFKTNVQLDFAQVLIAAGGDLGFDIPGLQKLQSAGETRCQTSFNNGAITTMISEPFTGRDYVVQMPSLVSINATDRNNGLLINVVIYMFYRSKIKGVEIEVNIAT